MSEKYIPISCSFYDRLEAWAIQCQHVEIQYRDVSGVESTVITLINDLQAKEGVEYAMLDNGLQIRLDQLIQVNGIPVEPTC